MAIILCFRYVFLGVSVFTYLTSQNEKILSCILGFALPNKAAGFLDVLVEDYILYQLYYNKNEKYIQCHSSVLKYINCFKTKQCCRRRKTKEIIRIMHQCINNLKNLINMITLVGEFYQTITHIYVCSKLKEDVFGYVG